MRRKLPNITESVDELKAQMKSETQVRCKQRLHMLYLLKIGAAQSRQQVSVLLGVHRYTVGDWLDRYVSGGVEEMLKIKTHPNRSYSLAPKVLDKLQKQLKSSEGFGSYRGIQQWLKAQFQLDIRYKTVHKIVRYDLKAKLKIPRKSHKDRDPGEVKEFKKSLTERLKKK